MFIINLEILQSNQKLDYKKVNSFVIKSKRNNIMFKLKLSVEIRIYPIFHILLLESANPNTLTQIKLFKLLLENKYEIKKIVDNDIYTS